MSAESDLLPCGAGTHTHSHLLKTDRKEGLVQKNVKWKGEILIRAINGKKKDSKANIKKGMVQLIYTLNLYAGSEKVGDKKERDGERERSCFC